MTRPRSLLLSSTTKNRSRSPDTLALFITSLNSFLEGIALLILKKTMKRAKGSDTPDSVWVTWLFRPLPHTYFHFKMNCIRSCQFITID